jgi:hypothetical protein
MDECARYAALAQPRCLGCGHERATHVSEAHQASARFAPRLLREWVPLFPGQATRQFLAAIFKMTPLYPRRLSYRQQCVLPDK